jgi:hypothetical protein
MDQESDAYDRCDRPQDDRDFCKKRETFLCQRVFFGVLPVDVFMLFGVDLIHECVPAYVTKQISLTISRYDNTVVASSHDLESLFPHNAFTGSVVDVAGESLASGKQADDAPAFFGTG